VRLEKEKKDDLLLLEIKKCLVCY